MTSYDPIRVAHDQLRKTTFRPHHMTKVLYPDLSILLGDESGYSLDDMNGNPMTKHLYEPLPLIHDNAVEAHAGRDNEEETSFFTITAAQPFPGGHLELSTTEVAFHSLIEDMCVVEVYMGHSTVSMVTYEVQNETSGVVTVWARLKRVTKLLHPGGVWDENAREYELPLRILHKFHNENPSLHWLTYLVLLSTRQTDRAYRHVRVQLASFEERDWTQPRFKPKRKQDATRLLEPKLEPVILNGEGCCICGEQDAPDLIALPCDRRTGPRSSHLPPLPHQDLPQARGRRPALRSDRRRLPPRRSLQGL
ncbi:hypothetical protein BAUCODRAFT_353117 [Baudoinia panamericana UAMH 10762]|uniref:Uncharacterized protein n=1 Tax=Baudoinia panamericana (strain UAMH 10762) TaxID=717646 RepID=M2LYT1_BAUPA|nr:uncharacterized protein BAUCODRAFT_353117 [Baudoinia panamericana UAMH 10762]EMC99862.1 hypothetical protein BAUCODRAFT_353117 [Baudoinia panamericana UAMH 10762]